MKSTELLTSMTEGIRNPNYFNGRVLTAQDLEDQQIANLRRHRQMGQAFGTGVVCGLTVAPTGQAAVVRIERGLAVNPRGDILSLNIDSLDIDLTATEKDSPSVGAEGPFSPCETLDPRTAPAGKGYYLLAARPASRYSEEKVPMVALDSEGIATGCGNRYVDEGITFALLALDEEVLGVNAITPGSGAPELARLRNRVAYRCFGAAALADFAKDPFAIHQGGSVYQTYGLIDELRQSTTPGSTPPLTDWDLPLAVIHWTGTDLGFVDMWPVRRRLVPPSVSALWPMHIGQRRMAEAEAMFLQFQDHLAAIVEQGDASKVKASEWFRFIPAAGYLPLGSGHFDPVAFFSGLAVDRWEGDPATLWLLVHQSWMMAPIDLTAAQRPRIQLYQHKDIPGYLLFLREDASRPAATEVTPPPSGETQPTAKKGEIAVILDLKPPPAALPEKDDFEIRATRTDAVKSMRTSRSVNFSVGTRSPHKPSLPPKWPVRFIITDLPPGDYLVEMELTGYQPASRNVAVKAGETSEIEVTLLAEESVGPGPGTGKPPAGGRAGWLGDWYGKMWVLEAWARHPWPPTQWPKPEPFPDPPPEEINQWLQQWAAWLHQQHPDAAIDPGDIDIHIMPEHDPRQIKDAPYAYLTFGKGGLYLPLILTASDQTLNRDLSMGETGSPAALTAVRSRLVAAGICSLEMLTGCWSTIVAEALDVGKPAAERLILESRDYMEALNENELRGHSGVDATLAGALKNAQVGDDIDLANQDPQALYNLLQRDASVRARVSLGFVHLLVDEARASIPKTDWSLEAAALGLRPDEAATLIKKGIGSQGELKRASNNSIGTALPHLTGNDITGLKGRIDLQKFSTKRRIARKAKAPVMDLAEVTSNMARSLAKLKLTTIGGLATADPEAVAALFSGDTTRATNLIEKAVEAMKPG